MTIKEFMKRCKKTLEVIYGQDKEEMMVAVTTHREEEDHRNGKKAVRVRDTGVNGRRSAGGKET